MTNLIFRDENIGSVVYDKDKECTYLVNEVGKFILKKLNKGLDKKEILQKVENKYEVDHKRAKKDLEKFISFFNGA